MLAVRTARHRRAGGNCHWQAAHCYRHQADHRHPIQCRRRHAIGFRLGRLHGEGIRRQIREMQGALPRILKIGRQRLPQAVPHMAEPPTVMQSIGGPLSQMLRSRKPSFATRRDGKTTLALTKGDLLRDLGVERTHGKTPAHLRCWEKKEGNSERIHLLCHPGPGESIPVRRAKDGKLPPRSTPLDTGPVGKVRLRAAFFSAARPRALLAVDPKQYRSNPGHFTSSTVSEPDPWPGFLRVATSARPPCRGVRHTDYVVHQRPDSDRKARRGIHSSCSRSPRQTTPEAG